MENSQNNRSFEQMAKDAQSKKRMQELAGISKVEDQQRSTGAILQDMIDEVRRIGDIVSVELRRRKEMKDE